MKKIYSLLLVLCLIFSLSACGGNETATDNDTGSFCTECGEEISAMDKFCGSCGASVKKSTTDNSTTNTTQNNDSSNSDSIDVPSSTTSKPTTTTKPNTPTHTHSYSSATCTAPAKCSCGVTNGSALGHSYSNATCTSPKKCSRCGATNGSALGHSYSNGACSRCNSKDPNYIKTYSIGETWIVDGQWEFTVNSVKTHNVCNSLWNSWYGYTSEQVVIIDYTYKNLGYAEENLDLYLSNGSFNVYDETGEAGALYSCTHTKYPSECIIGTKCTAQESYVLSNNSSKIMLVVTHYTSNGKGEAKASFDLKVN